LLSFFLMFVSLGRHRCHGRREVKAPELTAVQRNGKRCGRKISNNLCMSPSDPCSTILTTVYAWKRERTGALKSTGCRPCWINWSAGSQAGAADEDTLASTYKSNILLVQRQMSVTNEDLDNFQKVLKSYTDATAAHSDNLHVSVQKLPGKLSYIMYEFWQDRISWMSYLQSNSSKDFQRCVIDMLEDAEVVSTMLLPASWWIMTNN
ncbi:N-terminal EF-hand calcium-binding protein 1-like, partial [Etheostoma spectabile]|uniref:N-terminal EF-hand calcium-binding protein 1-like n=1 Tax=Etheostoma spectabile TaxID=54343 RepID=UPI0013AE9EE2